MEDRRWRSQRFYNPFVRKPSSASSVRPMFMGFLRAVVIHRWSMAHNLALFEFIARRPLAFGLPDAPTCVVNTTALLPSARARNVGISVMGPERGCKTLVVPHSCSGHAYDATDAKMIEPLFRWNPSITTVFLSKDCEPIAAELGSYIAKYNQRQLKTLILPEWESASAINKIAMAPKTLEMVDLFCPQTTRKDWGNEVAVEAWCELFEMHPTLKGIQGTTDVLHTVSECTRFCRCKHNVALVPTACLWTRFYAHVWFLLICMCSYVIAAVLFELLSRQKDGMVPQVVIDFVFPVSLALIVIALVTADFLKLYGGGRSWTRIGKVWFLARRRLDPFTRM